MSEWDQYRAEVENIALVVLAKKLGRFSETWDNSGDRAEHHRAANSKEWRDIMSQCFDVLAGIHALGMTVEPASEDRFFMVRRLGPNGTIESIGAFEARRKATQPDIYAQGKF